MELYDHAKVGKRIAWGRSHSVFRYGENEVIRFPRGEMIFRIALQDRLALSDRYTRDIDLCGRYFGDYALATRVVEDTAGRIATIQPFIRGHYLSKKDLQDAAINSQFLDFVARYKAMRAAGYEIDLIGQGGVLQHRFSNILVLPDGTLRLFDAKVFDMSKIRHSNWLVQWFVRVVMWKQRATLRYLLS